MGRQFRYKPTYRPLTVAEEQDIIKLTQEGQSSTQIGAELGLAPNRIVRERGRLGIRAKSTAGHDSIPTNIKLKPKHITAPYSADYGPWWVQNDRAFSEAMKKWRSEGGRIVNILEKPSRGLK